MRKIIFFPILLFALSLCVFAFRHAAAQTDFTTMGMPNLAPAQSQKPALSSPATIAMTFSKITRDPPPLTAWAIQTDAYKNATPIEQPSVLDRETQKLKTAFNLLNPSDPLVVETDVQLSSYSAATHGFFIQNFKTSTFFPSSYAGKYYALVPQDIADKQWLEVNDPATIDAITKAQADSKSGLLKMILFLAPQYGDATAAANIDGESYWPIVVEVKKMMLYPEDGDTVLWHTFDPNAYDKTHESILNLKQ